jgi:hypothetical protein
MIELRKYNSHLWSVETRAGDFGSRRTIYLDDEQIASLIRQYRNQGGKDELA